MDRNDLIAVGERTMERLRAGVSQGEVRNWIIRTTSGTTGARPLVIAVKHGAASLDMLLDARSVVVCMGALNARLMNVRSARYSDGALVRILALDGQDVADGISPLLDDMQPDVMRGVPSFMQRTLALLDAQAKRGFKRVLCTGEVLTGSRLAALAREAPNASIISTYATSELGRVGELEKCRYLEVNQFHPASGVSVAIAEPDATGAGRLLVTTRVSDEPVERYDVGDIARFLPPCACGAPIAFEILGRAGQDYVKLAGALVRREELDRVVARFPFIDDYRALVREVQEDARSKGHISLTLYVDSAVPTAALQKQVREQIERELYVTTTQTLLDLVTKGIFAPLEVTYARERAPRGHKDVKIIQRSE